MARPVDPEAFDADLSHLGALKTRLSKTSERGAPWCLDAQALAIALGDVLLRRRPLTRIQIQQLSLDLERAAPKERDSGDSGE